MSEASKARSAARSGDSVGAASHGVGSIASLSSTALSAGTTALGVSAPLAATAVRVVSTTLAKATPYLASGDWKGAVKRVAPVTGLSGFPEL
jgi:hypothetical protein